jgi:high-affinity nickel-transport protein
MTLIDSLDSILMLYSYSGFPEHGWSIFAHDDELTDSKQPLDVERDPETLPITLTESPPPSLTSGPAESTPGDITVTPKSPRNDDQRSPSFDPVAVPETGDERVSRDRRVEQNVLSGLSIVLTLMSILVAFACVRYTVQSICRETGL